MDGRKPKVFISYARIDQDDALRLDEHLEAAGCEPWLDVKDVLPGHNWKREIREVAPDSTDARH